MKWLKNEMVQIRCAFDSLRSKAEEFSVLVTPENIPELVTVAMYILYLVSQRFYEKSKLNKLALS